MESNTKIIVRFLPQGEGEDIVENVNTLIKEGVGLDEIQIDTAERKRSYRDNLPGVVIVNCKSAEDKKLIMDNKSNYEYNKVQIFHNKTPAQLKLEASLRTIVNVVGGDKLQMRGSQVVRKVYDPQSGQPRGRGSGRRRGGVGRGRGC